MKAVLSSAVFIVLYFFMHTHSKRLMKYIIEMTQLEDSIESTTLVGSIDLVDLVCFAVFAGYSLLSLYYSLFSYIQADRKYKQLLTNKHYNLYNLIFVDSTFEHSQPKEDLAVTRFTSFLLTFVSGLLLAFLFMPPKDEMLQFIN
mmetsp:Transcript_33195/g.50867  ORF Transcript_33195/g.50867 Transcript_33195/m.50867 type:complete len:145 (+) Transcript_33195:1428-1862(+)